MRNIEIFEALSALLFAKLYEQFPLRVDVNAYDIALSLGDELWDESSTPITEGSDIKTINRNKSPAGLSKPTIQWLKYAGLVDYISQDGSTFKQVCLTPKGLESIKVKPENESRLLKAAKDIAEGTAKDLAKKELKEAFSGILSWCAQHSPTVFQSISHMGG
ncbi:hypothetical protein KUL152_33010 [Tenacibaculum sp. KUL152]|nr:hypothetical protein KUL152_33010 [Tenacibaculum sp. KUL152]